MLSIAVLFAAVRSFFSVDSVDPIRRKLESADPHNGTYVEVPRDCYAEFADLLGLVMDCMGPVDPAKAVTERERKRYEDNKSDLESLRKLRARVRDKADE